MLISLLQNLNYLDFSAPQIPEQAQKFYPDEAQSFGEGLWLIVKKAVAYISPSISEAAGICVSLIGIVILICLLNTMSEPTKHLHQLIGTVAVSLLLIRSSGSLIKLGVETVDQLSEYGKLLLPVMTAALAAEGGITSSAALYTGTVIFNTILSALLTNLIIPLAYTYLAVGVAHSAVGNDFLKETGKFIKWLMTWILKISLYIFTGYISITGIVSGTADASAVKATKLAISGTVPVVGNILSDASETILISAGIVKNTTGVFGLLTVLALWIGPFLHVGIQYILLKLTACICGVFNAEGIGRAVGIFASVLGLLLAATGAICFMILISTVCFMRGVR